MYRYQVQLLVQRWLRRQGAKGQVGFQRFLVAAENASVRVRDCRPGDPLADRDVVPEQGRWRFSPAFPTAAGVTHVLNPGFALPEGVDGAPLHKARQELLSLWPSSLPKSCPTGVPQQPSAT